MVLFVNMLFKVILTWMKLFSVTILVKSIVVWFISLCEMVLAFKSVDDIPKDDHSNKRYLAQNYFPVVQFIVLYEVDLTSPKENIKNFHIKVLP